MMILKPIRGLKSLPIPIGVEAKIKKIRSCNVNHTGYYGKIIPYIILMLKLLINPSKQFK